METFQFLASYPWQTFWIVFFPNVFLLTAGLVLINCKKSPTSTTSTKPKNASSVPGGPSRPSGAAAAPERTAIDLKMTTSPNEKKSSDEKVEEPAKEADQKNKKNKNNNKKKPKEKTVDAGENASPTDGAEPKQSGAEGKDTKTTGTEQDEVDGNLEKTVRIEMSDDDHTMTRTTDSTCFDFNNMADGGGGGAEMKKSKKRIVKGKKKKTSATVDTTAELNLEGVGGGKKKKKKRDATTQDSVDCAPTKSAKKKLGDEGEGLKETPTQTHEEPAF